MYKLSDLMAEVKNVTQKSWEANVRKEMQKQNSAKLNSLVISSEVAICPGKAGVTVGQRTSPSAGRAFCILCSWEAFLGVRECQENRGVGKNRPAFLGI